MSVKIGFRWVCARRMCASMRYWEEEAERANFCLHEYSALRSDADCCGILVWQAGSHQIMLFKERISRHSSPAASEERSTSLNWAARLRVLTQLEKSRSRSVMKRTSARLQLNTWWGLLSRQHNYKSLFQRVMTRLIAHVSTRLVFRPIATDSA